MQCYNALRLPELEKTETDFKDLMQVIREINVIKR